MPERIISHAVIQYLIMCKGCDWGGKVSSVKKEVYLPMSSCGKQEEVLIKVKFKHNFKDLFLFNTLRCPIQNVSRYGAVGSCSHKVFEKMQEVGQSAHAWLHEFHDNLDWLVVVCPGVYTSILAAAAVIAQVDAQSNLQQTTITSDRKCEQKKHQRRCQSRASFTISRCGDFGECDASPCGAIRRVLRRSNPPAPSAGVRSSRVNQTCQMNI